MKFLEHSAEMPISEVVCCIWSKFVVKEKGAAVNLTRLRPGMEGWVD